jgi:hypothetical protein
MVKLIHYSHLLFLRKSLSLFSFPQWTVQGSGIESLNTGAWFPGIHQKERKATTSFLAYYAKEQRGARLIKYALPNTLQCLALGNQA